MDNRRKMKKHMTKDDLIRLLDYGNSYILRKLSDPGFGFEYFLKNQNYTVIRDPTETLEIVIHLISQACFVPKSNWELLSSFLDKIVGCDKFLFVDIPEIFKGSIKLKKNINMFMHNYIKILGTIMRFSPCDQVVETLDLLRNFMLRLKEQKVKNLHLLENCFLDLKRKVERYKSSLDVEDTNDVSWIEDFRRLSVVPKSDDVINCEIPDLPKNMEIGAYQSVDHYLGTHYRLLREDMLRSFRGCIEERDSVKRGKSRLYNKVRISYPPTYTEEGKCYDIKVTASKEIDLIKDSVLMPGNLVCLSPNAFETVVFAVIAEHVKASFSTSKECQLKIMLQDDLLEDELDPELSYQMVEPETYFECYKHVLTSIKSFNEETLPLSDVITYLEHDNIEPNYLEDLKYCLHEKCSSDDPHCCKIFNPVEYNEWPTPEELNLDEMQYEAFRTALTRKVALIQGPPGTGKTYLGVKIVKALLDNLPEKPIIITCFTNHALDQFLEKILEKKYTKAVVRLGSQCKSTALEPYMLENLFVEIEKYNHSDCPELPESKTLNIIRHFLNPVDVEGEIEDKMDREKKKKLKEVIKTLNRNLVRYSACRDNYLSEHALCHIIHFDHREQLKNECQSNYSLTDCILEWLCCKHPDDLLERCEKYFKKFEQQKDLVNQDITLNLNDIWSVNESHRFEMFYLWRKICLIGLEKDIEEGIADYKELKISLPEMTKPIHKLKKQILKNADIIGMTTTGAAKHRELLKCVHPQVIIIEEAAQVLEAHVIACLTEDIQHIILIGDHKQLRPLPADYELSEKYLLKISMFERLYNNGVPSSTLVCQHRMKPCIAELLVPEIYDHLESSDSVKKYEDIRGIKSSMFFLDHRESEDKGLHTSSSNEFEAKMIVCLAKYFCIQSYSLSDITILATYAAQVSLICKYLEEENLEIYATTVDNYQGEENTIVLVSFVRSNSLSIGFLKESNRLCVALSRAKQGMFCIGNFKLFSEKSTLWKSIYDKVGANTMVGDSIPLKCGQHGKVSLVKSCQDIGNFLLNGCTERCNFKLLCGHSCARTCHSDDSSHLKYRCKMPCERYIDASKICPRLCYERCKRPKKHAVKLTCGHYSKGALDECTQDSVKCQEEVSKCLPCKHVATLPCYVDETTYKCKAMIFIDLPCGHKKKILCCNQNQNTIPVCSESRTDYAACNHIVNVPCSLKLDADELVAFCNKSCNSLLDCGHPCAGCCRWCFDVGIHSFCYSKCDLMLPCGHTCKGRCSSPCVLCEEKCSLSCLHDTRCINSCLRPCIECTKVCLRSCDHVKCSKLCYEECEIEPCNKPCGKVLQCEHKCIGLCGDPCPFLCRVCHTDDLKSEEPLKDRYVLLIDCEHIIEVKTLDERVGECLDNFEWPSCPECNQPIYKSLRYKNQLKAAKRFSLESSDACKDDFEVKKLFADLFCEHLFIPVFFQDMHDKIERVLKQKQSAGSLYILKNCLRMVGMLLKVNDALEKNQGKYDEYVSNRFLILLLWISNHLTEASYQQITELEQAVNNLYEKI